LLVDLVVEITQRRLGYLDAKEQEQADRAKVPVEARVFDSRPPEGTFVFRGGCSIVVSMESGAVRACIRKDVLSPTRLERQRRFFLDPQEQSPHATY
jgi:hypothetical protein